MMRKPKRVKRSEHLKRAMLLTTPEGVKTPETQELIKTLTEQYNGVPPALYTINAVGEPIPLEEVQNERT
jgi:hypothetical protein